MKALSHNSHLCSVSFENSDFVYLFRLWLGICLAWGFDFILYFAYVSVTFEIGCGLVFLFYTAFFLSSFPFPLVFFFLSCFNFFSSLLSFSFLFLSLFCSRPDMTPAVDWALKTNYLSISLFSAAFCPSLPPLQSPQWVWWHARGGDGDALAKLDYANAVLAPPPLG